MFLAAGHPGPQAHCAAAGPAAGARGLAACVRRPAAAGRAPFTSVVVSQQQAPGATGVKSGTDECFVHGPASQPWTWLQCYIPGTADRKNCILFLKR